MLPPTPSIESLREGDRQALAGLFEIHADRVYRLAFGLLRERQAAEDVVQDTFLSAAAAGQASRDRPSGARRCYGAIAFR